MHDAAALNAGLRNITRRIVGTWPNWGIGAVQLPIGYFANVIDIGGGTGLALCTDGVGSKAIVAQSMRRYDTIGIDCVAMNVNDLLCVGARPLSMVDYIALDTVDSAMLDGIAIGLAEGARQADISISGGEIAQLREIVRGFDLVGAAIGMVSLDRIIVGRDVVPGDRVIGIASNGLHSNGYTHARAALFRAGLTFDTVIAELGCPLGEELLRPTAIYVRAVGAVLGQVPVKALAHITGDGLSNLTRIKAEIGFVLNSLPPPPPIFDVIERSGWVAKSKMFETYNMGIGFCLVVAERDVAATLAILGQHNHAAQVIGYAAAVDPARTIQLTQYGLIGRDKRFFPGVT